MSSGLSADAAIVLHLLDIAPRQREQLARAWPPGETWPSARQLVSTGVPGKLARMAASVTAADVDCERERAAQRHVAIVTRDHPSWPRLLCEIEDAPHALWVRGELPPPERLSVAIVGPRRPTPYGLAVTGALASELARLGAVIVSGGARGVDGEAHHAALKCGGLTVAVLGCGVDVAYPVEHRELFDAIACSGAVVSEHPCGVRPRKHHFPIRNRVLAGWCRAVLVTEATLRSGSLITARCALESGREVLAVPGPITSAASEGANELIARGAKLLRSAVDLLTELDTDELSRLHARSPPDVSMADASGAGASGFWAPPLPEGWEAGQAMGLDSLAAWTGLPAGPLLARLVAWEAAGRVRPLAGGLWARIA